MNETNAFPKTLRNTDLNKLSRLKALSWLSSAELAALVNALVSANFKRHEIILGEAALASDAHLLLTGIARITCVNAQRERVTVAIIAPGPIPAFPSWETRGFNFQCSAYKDCRVASLSRDSFDRITASKSEPGARRMHDNDLKQWYRLLVRGSAYLSPGLRDRVAHTLLELCSDFGVEEARGTLLPEPFSHQDIAELVGASRPRVTEHLARMELEHLVHRQGRQFIVREGELRKAISPRAN